MVYEPLAAVVAVRSGWPVRVTWTPDAGPPPSWRVTVPLRVPVWLGGVEKLATGAVSFPSSAAANQPIPRAAKTLHSSVVSSDPAYGPPGAVAVVSASSIALRRSIMLGSGGAFSIARTTYVSARLSPAV